MSAKKLPSLNARSISEDFVSAPDPLAGAPILQVKPFPLPTDPENAFISSEGKPLSPVYNDDRVQSASNVCFESVRQIS